MSSTLLCDWRWAGTHGIGRFAAEVLRRLPEHRRIERGPRPLSLAGPLWLTCRLVHDRPAVFFSPGFNPPPACPVPFVFTVHDLIQIGIDQVATPAKRLYYECILKPACRKAFRVLTVSEYSRGEILRWSGVAPHQVVNVGNGVGHPFVPEGPSYHAGFPYLLYVGNFRPHKNLDRLFNAFRSLDHPGLRLVLAGPPDPSIHFRLDRAGIRERTVLIPGPSDDKLAELYRGAELLALPSLMEGFGLPALEAMACGTPVVVSRTAALPEVVGDAGFYVDPSDTEDIRRGLDQALSNTSLRAAMRSEGICRARRFSWDAVAGAVETVLQAAAH